MELEANDNDLDFIQGLMSWNGQALFVSSYTCQLPMDKVHMYFSIDWYVAREKTSGKLFKLLF